jgi:hypothetical protein
MIDEESQGQTCGTVRKSRGLVVVPGRRQAVQGQRSRRDDGKR